MSGRRFLPVLQSSKSCDLSKIKDVVLTNMGPVSSLKIISTDISTPTIEMHFLETGLAKEIFGFLTAHSLDTWMEARQSRRVK